MSYSRKRKLEFTGLRRLPSENVQKYLYFNRQSTENSSGFYPGVDEERRNHNKKLAKSPCSLLFHGSSSSINFTVALKQGHDRVPLISSTCLFGNK